MNWNLIFLRIYAILQNLFESTKTQTVLVEPSKTPQDALGEEKPPKYLWDTRANAKHSVRLICDEEGLTLEQKNTLCATIACESNFNIHAINENKVGGKVYSTDRGICQWNDVYHGKEITPDEAMNNPEKAVRLMCAYWKRNQRGLWVCYSKNLYKQFL